MRGHILAATAVLAALGLAGCGDGDADAGAGASAETGISGRGEIADAYLEEIDSIAAAISSIEDEASAERAAETIRGATARLDAIAEEYGEDMDGMQGVALFMSRQQEMIQAQTRLAMAMQQLASEHPELMSEVGQAMDEMPAPGQ